MTIAYKIIVVALGAILVLGSTQIALALLGVYARS